MMISSAQSFKDTKLVCEENKSEIPGVSSMKERLTPFNIAGPMDDSNEESRIATEYDELPANIANEQSFSVFSGFKAWLMYVDGGLKKERDAALHVAQLKRIVSHAEHSQGDNVLFLFDTKELNEKWLNTFQKEKRPGTMKAYLHSLLHFCDFATENLAMFNIEQDLIRKVKTKIFYWSKSIQKKATKRKWEKKGFIMGEERKICRRLQQLMIL